MILLTAPPRTRKSTAIKKIVNMLGPKNCGGFYTEEIREDGEHVGFRINSLNGEVGILAHVSLVSNYKISRYGVDLSCFEQICLNELKRAVSSPQIKYIIIDEIGPMQLFSEEYKSLLLNILSIDKPVIGTVFYDSYEWLDEFKKRKDIKLIEINEGNRDLLPIEIINSIVNHDVEFQKKIKKAKGYMVQPERFSYDGNRVTIHSEHGIRTVVVGTDNRYSCDCEYYQKAGTCSHIIATIMNSSMPEQKLKIKK